MCGIAGFTGLLQSPDQRQAVLEAMTDSLQHRGPDDRGFWHDDRIALGHRRLSIIDLAGGHQPIAGADGCQIIFNGEIYNYIELRAELEAAGRSFHTSSDTEVLVQAYEAWGTDCLQRLNGMFAFAIWDPRRQRLFAARDRFGQKPFYYALRDGELIFASELKALLHHPAIERTVDPMGLNLYLALEYVPAPWTLLQGVQKLHAGDYLIHDGGQVRTERWWRPPITDDRAFPNRDGLSPRAVKDELRAHLADAVGLRLLRADVPVGVFLSGGVDSSLITALAREKAERVLTFSIGFDDPAYDESEHAKRVADHLGTVHHHRSFSAASLIDLIPSISATLDEPFADASMFPTYLLSQFAREHVTVCLGGDGGDELAAGYPTFKADRAVGLYQALPGICKRLIHGGVRLMPASHGYFTLDFKARQFLRGADLPSLERFVGWLGAFSLDERAAALVAEPIDVMDDLRALLPNPGLQDNVAQMLQLYCEFYLQNDILNKADRASMTASLELRAPLLDVNVAEYLCRLPGNAKFRGGTTKYILKELSRDFLPADIVDRRKQGFGIPNGRWLAEDLKPLMLDMLAPDRLARQGIFRPEPIAALIDDHLAARRNQRKPLWTLLMFQLWWDSYMVV